MPVRNRTFPCEATLTTPATAQKMSVGPTDFPVPPDYIEIGYASLACYIAPTEAALASAAAGDPGDRIYVAEGTIGRIIRWDGATEDLYFVNAVGGEQPYLAVVGFVGGE